MLLQWLRNWRQRFTGRTQRAAHFTPRLHRWCQVRLELLEDRIAPATVNWIGGSGDWSAKANWQDATTLANHLPGPTDDAVINVPGVTITHSSGADTVQSLTSNDPFTLSGGTLTITHPDTIAFSSFDGAGTPPGTAPSGFNGGSAFTLSHNEKFTPSASGTLSQIYIALEGFNAVGQTATATVALESDAQGKPSGTVLESWTTSNIHPANFNTYPPEVLTDTTGQFLSAGTAYWLVVSSPTNNVEWNLSDAGGGTSAYEVTEASNPGLVMQNGNLFTLSGGTLAGASVAAGTAIRATNAGGTLSRITLNGNLDLATNNNASVNVSDGLVLNGTINIGSADGSNFDTLEFADTQAVSTSGSGDIVFGGSQFSSIVISSGTSVTVNAGITIDGQNGVLGTGVPAWSQTITGGNLVNNGTIAADLFGAPSGNTPPGGLIFAGAGLTNAGVLKAANGETLSIGRAPTIADTAWTNSGTISVDGRSTINLNGASWSNTGTISSTNNSTVNLGSTFNLDNLGTFNRTGGTVNLVGTLNNSSPGGLVLNAATGPWNLAGGTINGGVVATDGTNNLVAADPGFNGGDILSGVTLDGVLDLATHNNVVVNVSGGLTLNGTIDIGKADGSNFDTLAFSGSQAVDTATGGTITFGGSALNSIVIPVTLPTTTLTVNSGVTIDGKNGIIGTGTPAWRQTTVGGNLVNNGTIAADGGGSITLNNGSWTNNGTVTAQNGSTLLATDISTNVSEGTLTGGTWQVVGASTLRLRSNVSTSAATILLDGAGSNIYSGSSGTSDALASTFANIAVGGIFTIQDGRNFTAPAAFSDAGNLVIGAGSTMTDASGVSVSSGGILQGNGTVAANVTNSGTISSGKSPEILTINGNCTQTNGGTLDVGIAGTNAGKPDFDQLNISGNATLDGTLNVSLLGAFQPGAGNSFQVMSFGSVSGDFATENGLTSGNLPLTPSYSPTGSATSLSLVVAGLPVVNPDALNTPVNTMLTLPFSSILANDTGIGLSPHLVTGTTNGELFLNFDGHSLTYTPNTDFAGIDSFTYEVRDTNGQVSNVATDTIAVDPPAPVANAETFTTAFNTTLSFAPANLLANDTGTGLNPVIVTTTTHGTLTQVAGEILYVPDATFSGNDTFTYQDTDVAGQTSDTVTDTLTVDPPGPVASADAFTAGFNTTLTVNAPGVLGNDTGSGLSAQLVTTTANGTLTLNTDGSLTYVPEAGFSGTDSFTYRDKDTASQLSKTMTDTITVNPPPPLASDDGFAANFGTSLTVKAPGVLANDTGTGLTALLVSTTANGTLTFSSDGSFTYVPNSNFSGSDTFAYQDQDAIGQLSNTVTDTITVRPRAPVATAETFTTSLGITLTVNAPGVLANDAGTALNAQVVTTTANGALTLNSDGSLTYVPYLGFSGTDSFTYRAKDAASQLSNTVTDTITVTPPLPVANADTLSTTFNSSLNIAVSSLLVNDTGIGLTPAIVATTAHGTLTQTNDGFLYVPDATFSGVDSFTYQDTDIIGQVSNTVSDTIDVAPPAPPLLKTDSFATGFNTTLNVKSPGVLYNDIGAGLTAVLGTTTAHGTLTLNGDGSLTYVPTRNFTGNDSFTYQARDVAGQLSDFVTDAITVLAAVPVANADTFTTGANTTLTVTAPGVLTNDTGTGVVAEVVSGPANGALSLNSDGSFIYIPNTNFTDTDTFTYHDRDGSGQVSTPATVTITVMPSTRTFLAAPASWVFGQSVVFTAVVKPGLISATGTPTGQVVFTIDGTPQAPVNMIGAVAWFVASNLAAGSHAVQASYQGDANFFGSKSITLTQTLATTTQVRSTAARAGQPVTLTATVAASSARVPTGTVTFMDGKKKLGTVRLSVSGQAKLVLRIPLAAGSHAITAIYEGNGTFAGSTSKALRVALTSLRLAR